MSSEGTRQNGAANMYASGRQAITDLLRKCAEKVCDSLENRAFGLNRQGKFHDAYERYQSAASIAQWLGHRERRHMLMLCSASSLCSVAELAEKDTRLCREPELRVEGFITAAGAFCHSARLLLDADAGSMHCLTVIRRLERADACASLSQSDVGKRGPERKIMEIRLLKLEIAALRKENEKRIGTVT